LSTESVDRLKAEKDRLDIENKVLQNEKDVAEKELQRKIDQENMEADVLARKIANDSKGYLPYNPLKYLPLDTLKLIQTVFAADVSGYYHDFYMSRHARDTAAKRQDFTVGPWDSEKKTVCR
jgi:predicted Zn-dependent peptidase